MDATSDPLPAGYAAVLIDIVASRDHADRPSLQAAVKRSAGAVNDVEPFLDPLTLTVGDELQGTYPGVLAAIRATARLRLELIDTVAIRAGIGWGDIEIHDPDRTPFAQDGSAWWAARAALDTISRSRHHGRLAAEFASTAPASVEPRGGLPAPQPADVASPAFVTSHLRLLDHALDRLDGVEARIVLGDLDRRSTELIAGDVGISASGVSQRRRRNDLRAITDALDALHTSS